MSGICGSCDFFRDGGTLARREEAHQMGEGLTCPQPVERGLWQSRHCVLVHRRPACLAPQARQPMVRGWEGAEYALVWDGALTNGPELRRELAEAGFPLDSHDDTETLLAACILWGVETPRRLRGSFAYAFWDGGSRRLLCCRDRLGGRSLFWTWVDGTFLFASQQRALFCFPGLAPRLSQDGLRQLLSLAPVPPPGIEMFEGIHLLPPASLLIFSPDGVSVHPYWALESRPHPDDYPTTAARVRQLADEAVRRELAGSPALGSFLSGSLSSSFVTAAAALAYTEDGRPPLDTWSLQRNGESSVRQVADAFHTRHRALECPLPSLVNCMEEEGEILEFPAMALSDAGLFFLCLQVSGTCHTVLTGTGGGCILGGSLWPEGEGGTFLPLPRSTALPLGRQIFDPGLWHSSGVEEHGRDHLSRLLDRCPTLDGESPRETQRRRESWLAFNWLLPALLARNERLGRASGLDLRSPLCDHLLVEYAWNIPWSMKTANGRPLQLLRDGTEDLLPQAVRDQAVLPRILAAESLYGQLVRARLARLLDDTNAPIRPLAEERALRRLRMEDGGAPVGSSIPKAHVMAYLVQLNRWMEAFHLSV